MKRRTLVCSAVGAGTLLALRWRRSRRSQREAALPAQGSHAPLHDRPTLRLIPALALFVWLHLGFRIPGPWDDIKDAATGVANAVKNWVIDLLTAVFDFIWDWAVGIYKMIIDGFKDIWTFARDLDAWTVKIVNAVIDLINRKIIEATNFASWIVGELRAQMWDALSRVGGVVIDLAGFGAKIIQDAYNLVAEKIYWPLWHLIQDVYTWINANVIAGMASLINQAISNAIGGLLALPNLVSSLWHWVWNYADDLLKIVSKAKDFLLFVIAHPLTWWMTYLQRIVDAAPEVIFRGVVNAVERNMPATEDLAVKIIG